MSLRIDSENQLALLKAVVRENLGHVWVTGEMVTPFQTSCEAKPVAAFDDSALSVPADPSKLTKRLVVIAKEGRSFYFWKGVNLPFANYEGDGAFFLMDDGNAIFAFQTDISKRDDGIVQLGGEKGLCLLLPQHVQAQRGKRTLEGETFHAFRLEELDESGEWQSIPMSIYLDEAQVEKVTLGGVKIELEKR